MAGVARKGGLAWFVRSGAGVRGPFTSAKIRHSLLDGVIAVDDEISLDREAWQPIAKVPEVLPTQLRHAEGFADDRAARQSNELWHSIRSTVLASVIIGIFIAAVVEVGHDSTAVESDCLAPPTAGVVLEGCILSDADLAGAELAAAQLANINLRGARLAGAKMHKADLRYAHLSNADLSYANLGASVLLGASLRYADLTNADLSEANLEFADLTGARIGGARFGGARFDGAIWVDGVKCTSGSCPR